MSSQGSAGRFHARSAHAACLPAVLKRVRAPWKLSAASAQHMRLLSMLSGACSITGYVPAACLIRQTAKSGHIYEGLFADMVHGAAERAGSVEVQCGPHSSSKLVMTCAYVLLRACGLCTHLEQADAAQQVVERHEGQVDGRHVHCGFVHVLRHTGPPSLIWHLVTLHQRHKQAQ